MAKIVNEQNIHDNNNYHAMAPNYEHNLAYQAAYNLIFQGHIQPNGYIQNLCYMPIDLNTKNNNRNNKNNNRNNKNNNKRWHPRQQ